MKNTINIKTLYKIDSDIYMLENQELANELFAYENGVKKRIDVGIVREAIRQMIKNLKQLKIKKLDKTKYLVEAGKYKCDFIGKKETKQIYINLTKKRVRKLENFIKKYL